MSRIYAIFLRQIFLIKSNPTRLVSIFLWSAIDIIQWGFISKYLGSLGQATFDYITVILGAIILWEFISRIQQGIMTGFLEDIWSQNFINFFASPLKIRDYLSGLVLSGVASSFLSFLVLVITAGFIFGYNIFKIGLLLLPFIFILFLFGTAMGIFVSAIIFRLGPSAEWLAWPIPLILSLFSGVFYPISALPSSLQILAKFIPASYVFESIRAIISTPALTIGLGANLLLATVVAVIYLFLAYWMFIKIYRYNLRTGAISRFSAES